MKPYAKLLVYDCDVTLRLKMLLINSNIIYLTEVWFEDKNRKVESETNVDLSTHGKVW